LASFFEATEAVGFVAFASFVLIVGLSGGFDGSSRVVGSVEGDRAGTGRTFEELREG
jgi:hypothetical protein